MYLVSIYFDENTDKKIRTYMKQVAEKTGNRYMMDGEVPPHITISSFETTKEEEVIRRLDASVRDLKMGTLQWASVGVFLPSVVFLSPVVNEYLHSLSETIYQAICEVEGITISRCYRPFQWMPHTTVGKKLTAEEMQQAFLVLQKNFHMFSGEVIRIGLAKTNPYRDIVSWEL